MTVFENKLYELHQAGFVHRHLLRSCDRGGLAFDNILLTENGLCLIDVGSSALRSQVGDVIFKKYMEIELQEMKIFRAYFLNR